MSEQIPMREQILKWLRQQRINGTDTELIPTRQIVLLGGNSLPTRVILEALRPEHAIVIATTEVEKVITDLCTQAGKFGCRVEAEIINSTWDANAIQGACRQALHKLTRDHSASELPPIGLHYSGGTKPMSSHTHTWWRSSCDPNGSHLHRCTYLDPYEGLVFDGLSVAFSEIKKLSIPLKDIISLHGLQIKSKGQQENLALVSAIGQAVFVDESECDPQHAKAYWRAIPKLYGIKLTDVPFQSIHSHFDGINESWMPNKANDASTAILLEDARAVNEAEDTRAVNEANDASTTILLEDARATSDKNFKGDRIYSKWNLDPLRAVLGSHVIPDGATCKDFLKRTTKAVGVAQYFTSIWFEEWLANRLNETNLFKDIWQGYEYQYSQMKSEFKTELDIVLCDQGYTTILVSCTIDDSSHSKQKVFEALLRANQLAGDHTRFILASWQKDEARLRKLWQQIARHWDEGKRFRVLGWEHYLEKKAYTHDENGSPRYETIEEMFKEWLK